MQLISRREESTISEILDLNIPGDKTLISMHVVHLCYLCKCIEMVEENTMQGVFFHQPAGGLQTLSSAKQRELI